MLASPVITRYPLMGGLLPWWTPGPHLYSWLNWTHTHTHVYYCIYYSHSLSMVASSLLESRAFSSWWYCPIVSQTTTDPCMLVTQVPYLAPWNKHHTTEEHYFHTLCDRIFSPRVLLFLNNKSSKLTGFVCSVHGDCVCYVVCLFIYNKSVWYVLSIVQV